MTETCTDKIVEILKTKNINGFDVEGGTDKITIHSYSEIYGKHLNKYLDKKGSLLEIGVKWGGSAVLWNELLPNFKLCLVDIENIMTPVNWEHLDKNRMEYLIGDAYNEGTRNQIKEKYPEGLDVITDDGPHTLDSQLKCIELYLPLIKEDGVMVIEDVANIQNLNTLMKSVDSNYDCISYDYRHIKNREDDIVLVIKKRMKKCKIVMTAMFKNEASVTKKMLESCYKYIDFWVVQDNGSTDGTDKIVKDFFAEKNIPGHYYQVEEGWVGFGWNRDHLIQVCQSIDHGCDWILKMDCDETLEVDADFDWSLLDDKSQHSFHISAVQNSCVYYRAWMWNAKMPWRFNHDPCHETSYCDIEGIGEQYNRFDLPLSFRQFGTTGGQSWTVPTKFISDALILEEKMIRENTILTDSYHFWYIGKSYNDAYPSNAFPLGESQRKEYARRTIYYFQEFLNFTHDFANTRKAKHIDETAYLSILLMGDANWFLGQRESSVECYELAAQFAPERNDHLYLLAEKNKYLGNFKEMLVCTSIMMQPERTNPFPKYINFIDTTLYHDGGDRIKNLHAEALSYVQSICDVEQEPIESLPIQKSIMSNFNINRDYQSRMFIVDNFYGNPDSIRKYALTMEFKEDIRYYKGLRTTTHFHPDGIKEAFESIMGKKINNFDGGINGCFQITTANDPQVYHYDLQTWAAMIYLTPNAPIESGTRVHRSKINGTRHSSEPNIDGAFTGGFLDSTKFDVTDSAANIYNRLVIMDARCIHSAGQYFGQGREDGRLTHLFFFD